LSPLPDIVTPASYIVAPAKAGAHPSNSVQTKHSYQNYSLHPHTCPTHIPPSSYTIGPAPCIVAPAKAGAHPSNSVQTKHC